MAMLTEDLLRKLCPKASDDFVKAFASPEAEETFSKAGMLVPSIMAMCMANVCHETGGGTIVRESLKYRAKRLMEIFPSRYRIGAKGPDGKPIGDKDGDGLSDLAELHAGDEHAIGRGNYGFRLGNEDDGINDDDGYSYRGGGPLQTTGKDNYRYIEKQMGVPFGSNPKLIENPAYWAEITAITWTKHMSAGNLNPIALQGNFEGCCRGINTGNPFSTMTVNGMDGPDGRIAWFKKWSAALDAKPPTLANVFRFGSPKNATVASVQKRLNALNYAEGKLTADGMFGQRTRSAVMDFQLENGLNADGIVTPEVLAKLLGEDAKPFPAPSYVALGVAGARKAGDPVVAQADRDKAAAVVLGSGAVLNGANQAGMFDGLTAFAKDAGTWQTSIQGLAGLVKFAATNALMIGAAIAAYFLYRKYGAAIADRFGRWAKPVGTKGDS